MILLYIIIMKLSSIFICILPIATYAFKVSPIEKPLTKTFQFNGDIAPTGFFDPMQITSTSDEKTLKYMREAELQHGRIAMVASVILPVLDMMKSDELAIHALSDSSLQLNQACLFSMGLFELGRMVRVYKRPIDGIFQLKDDVEPGQLNPYYTFNESLSNKELSNGRLAMLAALGYIAQELVTQQPIF